jgi:Mg2+ and Co2+ transporters
MAADLRYNFGKGERMEDENPQIKAYLYDASGADERIEIDDLDFAALDEDTLLWITVLQRDVKVLERVVERLDLKNIPLYSIVLGSKQPRIDKFEGVFRFSVNSVLFEGEETPIRVPIDFVVGRNFVITVHDGMIDYFEEFRRREKGETQFGQLDAESFVATLVDLHIVSYFRVLDEIDKRVDKLDSHVLKKDIETDLLLSEMVDLRKSVSKLRRWLMPHREVIYAFLRADFQQISESDSLDQYKLLANHFEHAVDAVESSRETVLSVFDLYATKSAQTMNIFIKRLTFLTLMVGTLSVISGVLGMSFKVDFFDSPNGFWITIAGMLLLAGGSTVFARYKRWI